MKEYLNEVSELAEEGVHRKTIAASRIILGGLVTQPFWGFSFLAFTKRFDARLKSYLPDPARTQLNLVPGYDALRDYDDSRVDRVSDPVRNVTHESAEALAARVTVVGLAGERGTGRGVLADHLVDTYNFSRMEFMDPLRVAAAVLYNIPLHYFSTPDLAQKRIPHLEASPEKVLHILGSDVCQGLRRSIWNDRLLLRMAAVSAIEPHRPPPNIVVSGLRFEDEAEFVRSLPGGRVAWLSRTGTFSAVASGAMRDDDLRLVNNGTLRDFLVSSSGKLGLVVPQVLQTSSGVVEPSQSSIVIPAPTSRPLKP